jgi:ferric-dicitrate binding protein FerR (iron transport regulator)
MVSDDQRQLIRAYLDGSASEDQVRELNRLLAEDREVRCALLDESAFDARLRMILTRQRRSAAGLETARGSRKAKRTRYILACVAAAASLLVAVGVAWHARMIHRAGGTDARCAASTPSPVQQPAAPAIGRLMAMSGDVRMGPAGGGERAIAAAAGAEVHPGDTVITATNASAQFAYADGSTLQIYRGSALVLGRSDLGPTLELRSGAMDASIRKQPDGQHLRILGNFLHADIVGTEFRLMSDSKSVWLGVRKGEVAVTRVADGQKVSLGTGNYAAVSPQWPYMRMDARVCPVWKSICRQATDSAYP